MLGTRQNCDQNDQSNIESNYKIQNGLSNQMLGGSGQFFQKANNIGLSSNAASFFNSPSSYKKLNRGADQNRSL
jgi:hypothetical protein